MSVIKIETYIRAPIEECFDLARNIDIHTQTVWKQTKEKAVAGVTSGVIGLNEMVTFEAVHFGVRQRLTSKIVEYDRPFLFVDEMQKGAFKHMKHIHSFKEYKKGTLMTDILDFSAPFGIIGRVVDFLILERYMKRFLIDRNEQLKKIIEK